MCVGDGVFEGQRSAVGRCRRQAGGARDCITRQPAGRVTHGSPRRSTGQSASGAATGRSAGCIRRAGSSDRGTRNGGSCACNDRHSHVGCGRTVNVRSCDCACRGASTAAGAIVR
jgi:hypothetical protein